MDKEALIQKMSQSKSFPIYGLFWYDSIVLPCKFGTPGIGVIVISFFSDTA